MILIKNILLLIEGAGVGQRAGWWKLFSSHTSSFTRSSWSCSPYHHDLLTMIRSCKARRGAWSPRFGGKKQFFGVVVGQVQSFVCGSFAKIISRDLFWARTRIHSLSKVFITWYYRHTDGGGHIAYNHKLWNLMLFVILLTCFVYCIFKFFTCRISV